jgi:hypothetical protein
MTGARRRQPNNIAKAVSTFKLTASQLVKKVNQDFFDCASAAEHFDTIKMLLPKTA